MKSGTYTIYNDKEYRIGKTGEDWVNLVSRDENDLQNGFQRHKADPTFFIKKIKKEELTDVYRIRSHAVYKGTTFGILVDSEDRDIYVLSGDEECAEKFPMEYHNRGEFTMEVPRKDVEVVERRRIVNIEDL